MRLHNLLKKRHTQIAEEPTISTWREYNRSIFGVLRMEKLIMTLVIGLVFVVVGMNIFHDLRVSVLEKQEELGVLRAMGASPAALQGLFVLQGLIVGTIGALGGFIIGVLLVQNLNALYSGFLELLNIVGLGSSQSFLPELPVALRWDESIVIACMADIAALVAAWLASRRISKRDAASILRYE
jgi:lipoprotein-releasing system permease protein